MKKIVSINLGNFGSTGTIMNEISRIAESKGYLTYQVYPGRKENKQKKNRDIIMCSEFVNLVNQKLAYYTGYNGCFAWITTLRLIKKLKKIDPDLLHLHNLHNSYINYRLLFNYIKKNNISVVWTLHDCWSFTGNCAHFLISKCDKWTKGCKNCNFYKEYPQALSDKTNYLWNLKRKCFTGVEKLVIVTPSKWLESNVKKSYLKDYRTVVINNGIDLEKFIPSTSIIKKNKMILGVAFGWDYKKGLDIFIKLSNDLPKEYTIVLVGTDELVDKRLPSRIQTIHKTSNIDELVELYQRAHVLVNASREETFPTVNIEALACGTPVITFNAGGSAEMLDDKTGIFVEVDDYSGLLFSIKQMCSCPANSNECRKKALEFSAIQKFNDYVSLYDEILNKNKE